MLKVADLESKALEKFKECLFSVPSLKIDSVQSQINQIGDYRIVVEGNRLKQIIYLEVKSMGTPKNIRESVIVLQKLMQDEPGSYCVIVAPYISPAAATICKQAGIGYVDLSGNCLINFQQIYISRENKENSYPFTTSLSSIYSPKSERILRVLLNYPYQYWKAIDLAKEAQVSLGMITHVSKKLIDEEWMKKTALGISLIDPEKLLLDWANNYAFKRNMPQNFYSIKSIQETEQEIAKACDEMNILYALTAFSASNRLAPIVTGQRATIYVNQLIPIVAKKVSMKPVESGANVILIAPYDEGVFWSAELINGIKVANPVQVYLDLKQLSGRGEEAADFLFQEVLSPRWQQRKMNTINSL